VDAVPTIEITTPARETLRDHRGLIIGRIEHQALTGKLIARDVRGVVTGSFDRRETRDARGRVIGRRNLLSVLLGRAR
jgi:hypothetical protein